MRILIYYIVAFIFLSSCNNKTKSISLNAMKEVMWALLNAEELMKIKAINDSTYIIKNNRAVYYQKIFSLHQITQKDFDKNFEFYQNHPSEMKILLDSISNFGIKKREKAMISL